MKLLIAFTCAASLSVVDAGSRGFLRARAAVESPSASLDETARRKGSGRKINTFAHELTNDMVVETFSSHVADNATDGDNAAEVDSSAHDSFELHTMLLWASRTAANWNVQEHPDFHKQTFTGHLNLELADGCVSDQARLHWHEGFVGAVDMMLEKTMHGMQHGLLQLAHNVVEVVDGTNCGLMPHAGLDQLRTQASRLRVLAGAGSLDDLEITVKYEPLKALTVGGVDVHSELNALLIAWKLNHGPEAMGKALAELLHDFVDEADTADVTLHDDAVHETRTPKFWADVLQTAMVDLGGGEPDTIKESCLSADVARKYGDALEDGIARMLEKTAAGMRAGIKEVATATVAFVDGLESPCSQAPGAANLRQAAERVKVFAAAKTLVQASAHVEYEPMKTLKIGGIDVHKELNQFLVAWIHKQGAKELADGMVAFFDDFREKDILAEEQISVAPEGRQEPEMLKLFRDALNGDSSRASLQEILPAECVSDSLSVTIVDGIERAVESILQKNGPGMQLGLQVLAETVDDAIAQMKVAKVDCITENARNLEQGAKRLRSLSTKAMVDYSSHIQYEALKSLVVGNVDAHQEINDFIRAWKLGDRREAGEPFGSLMRKFAHITGHDEL